MPKNYNNNSKNINIIEPNTNSKENDNKINISKNQPNNNDISNDIKKEIGDLTIIFNRKLFKKNNRISNYKTKDNIKRIIYKCCNNRKEEDFRLKIKIKNSFCNATILYIYPNQHKKSGYFLIKEHSSEFLNINKNTKKTENILEGDKNTFIKKCEDIMNSSTIYDRNLFKTKFQDIY